MSTDTAGTLTSAADRIQEAADLLGDAAARLLVQRRYGDVAELTTTASQLARSAKRIRPLFPPPDLPQRPVHPAQVARAALDPDSLPDGGVK